MKKTTLTTLDLIKVNNFPHKITCTVHGIERMEERGIEIQKAVESIKEINEKRLAGLKKIGQEMIIIDKERNISTVVAFIGATLRIITVIKKSNVFVKKGTFIVNL